MGFGIMLGFCCSCKSPIQFNPRLVPSLRINNKREPLCFACATRWNQIHPESAKEINEKAYEGFSEEELSYD